MAIFHCSIKIVSRGKSKSVVGASAYRSGEKFTNNYDGVTHDYTRKSGIAFTGILLPTNAPIEYADRSTLWNAVELVEKAKNAQLARDIEVSIPKESPKDKWVQMIEEYCKSNFINKGMIADYCIHDKNDGNPHCHILLTMRPINDNGKFGAKAKKEYILDDNGEKIKLPSGNWKSFKVDSTDWNNRENAELWRGNWANICNSLLDECNITEHIDHRSYERLRLLYPNDDKYDKIPSIHLGVACSQMEVKGISTERGTINREVAENNKLLNVTRARITRLMKWQLEEKLKPLVLDDIGIKPSVIAQLQAFTPRIQDSQYQKIKNLKSYASILSFINSNHIDSLDDFYNKISDMNKSFYTLKGEITSTDKKISDMQSKIDLWDEYKNLKPFLAKYNALSKNKKAATYDKDFDNITRALELQAIFKEYKDIGYSITPKVWSKKCAELKNNRKLYQWKMDLLRDELSRVEQITKTIPKSPISMHKVKSNWKDSEL